VETVITVAMWSRPIFLQIANALYSHLSVAIPHSLSIDLIVLVAVFILEELSVNLKKD